MSKSELRKFLRSKRVVISPEKNFAAAEAAAEIFSADSLFQKSFAIACYLNCADEFNTKPIIEKIWQTERECYLPVIAKNENTLEFMRYQRNDVLYLNRYQIYEPRNEKKISLDELNIVIFPLLGFDLAGHRLGMGGGYYDRTFASLNKNPHKKTFFLGLAFEVQRVENLPHDVWDIPLDGVLTEKQLYRFSS